uniref:RNA polymerase sigma factor n=1 Tax=Anthurium amnicola TaxID=1678845 RepID=A0A1D1YYY3_9ARAE
MSCLAPQFKRPPDAHFSIRPSQAKARDIVCFRGQCVMSSATMVCTERLQISTLESHSASVTAVRPLPYVGAVGPPAEMDFEVALATENLLKDEESVIAAAAAEAVALARAAAEVAKDAAQMVGMLPSQKLDKSDDFPSNLSFLRLETSRLIQNGHLATFKSSATTEGWPDGDQISQFLSKDAHNSSSKGNDVKHLETQHSKNIAIRSGRQNERKARRARVAEKAATGAISVKSGSSGRKKRGALQEIDYSDPLYYLRATTCTSRLLTATEELELSEGIQDLLKLEKLQEELAERYGGQPTFAQWAAAAGVDQKTLRKRLNYGMFCKDKMIKSNIRLVISIAKNYQGAGMNLPDLVQEGCRGLVRGAEKFDASKGFKFSTYAHWWIKQAVRKSLTDQSRTIRLPFHMVEATYRVREARKQLYSENGRYPDNKEVAEATGLSMKKLTTVLLTPKAPRSLDQKVGINQNLKPSEVIANPDAETAEDILMKQFMKQDLDKVLDSLNPREKQVVRWRFGLEDGRMKTLQEIGELMGVSRERIRQIESCAFRKLKNKSRTKSLRQYLVS